VCKHFANVAAGQFKSGELFPKTTTLKVV